MRTDEARRQSRRERVLAHGMRARRHRVSGKWLCCECYVNAGNEPAEFHSECMAAAAALKDASDTGHA